ncbi:MAG: chemotaxis-specific protein-glutamate methyltransferase CheB [Candidatus Methylomirabilia bacterium]
MIRVLIVDDLRVAQQLLTHILGSDPEFQVVGVADNGEDALEAVHRLRPDVVTMDVHLPGMDGFEATRAIMETIPTPIVIVSGSTDVKDQSSTFRLIEAGALAALRRPPGVADPEFKAAARELIQTVKLMSEIKLVRLTRRSAPMAQAAPLPALWAVPRSTAPIQVVAIGASTGGPQVLQTILSGLSPGFGAPVLIVQHIAKMFTAGFAEWLSGASRFPVRIATAGEELLPGRGYLAPEGFHLGVGGGPRIVLSQDPPDNGLRPSVHHLFHSVAAVCGPRAVGVLLTGMGRDGAAGLAEMRQRGATTIAQNEASSVIFGMPGEAIKLGAAHQVLPPEGIVALLAALVGAKPPVSEINSYQRR